MRRKCSFCYTFYKKNRNDKLKTGPTSKILASLDICILRKLLKGISFISSRRPGICWGACGMVGHSTWALGSHGAANLSATCQTGIHQGSMYMMPNYLWCLFMHDEVPVLWIRTDLVRIRIRILVHMSIPTRIRLRSRTGSESDLNVSSSLKIKTFTVYKCYFREWSSLLN